MNRKEGGGVISSRFLEAMGGKKVKVKFSSKAGGGTYDLVDNGAYWYDVPDRDKGKGVLNHNLKTGRVAVALGKDLKRIGDPRYKDIDLGILEQAAALHDIVKLFGEDREKLTPEQKEELSLPRNFREIHEVADQFGINWMNDLGFPSEVSESIRAHDFPQRIIDNPYWKIVLLADYMTGQHVMTVADRLNDVRTRWIDERIAQGEDPRIEPERFDIAERNIQEVADEIFTVLDTDDASFIEMHNLNNDESQTRAERFIRKTRDKNPGHTKQVVKMVENIAARGNYGRISYSERRKNNRTS